MMKKKYSAPQAENVKLVVGPIMNIVEGSSSEIGSGDGGEDGSATPDIARFRRGEWGNLWK